MLEVKSVSKSFGATKALDQVSLDIAPEQTTVLIGPSGCGKSTLLRIMMGLLASDSGEVRFLGAAVTPQTAQPLRPKMGYVIQDGGLFPHLTAAANVSLTARYLGWEKPRIRERLEELSSLTRFPMDGLDRYPVQLSGGQRQRVSLMRSLMLDPKVLLLDEPLGALDPMIRHELQRDLRNIFRTLAKTVVMVTHDMCEASYLGQQLVLMREGRIVQIGTSVQLMNQPVERFVADFVNAQKSPLGDQEVAA